MRSCTMLITTLNATMVKKTTMRVTLMMRMLVSDIITKVDTMVLGRLKAAS